MTKLEAYIMKFLYYYRKAKEYYFRVIHIWVVIVGNFCFGIFFFYLEYVFYRAYWGKEFSFFYVAVAIVVLILKLRGKKL